MKIINNKLKKYLCLAALSIVSATPIAVAVSCGESSSPSPVEVFETKLSEIKVVQDNSHHEAITWGGLSNASASRPAEVTGVSYYYGPLSTTAEVAAATNLSWASELPTKVSAATSERHLFAKLTLANNAGTSDPIIDLTISSGIQNVKLGVTVEDRAFGVTERTFFSGEPSDVFTINFNFNNDLDYQFPSEYFLVYKLSSEQTWRKVDAFITHIHQNAARYTKDDLKTVQAQFLPAAETTLLINNRVIDVPYRQEFLPPAALLAAARTITFMPGSTSQNITWNTTEFRKEFPVGGKAYNGIYIHNVLFFLDDAPTLEALLEKTTPDATNQLPSSVSADLSKRNLYARFVISGTTPSQRKHIFFSLTDSARIREIPSA